MTNDEREALLTKITLRVAEEIRGAVISDHAPKLPIHLQISQRYAEILTGRILMRLTKDEIIGLLNARFVTEELDDPSGVRERSDNFRWINENERVLIVGPERV